MTRRVTAPDGTVWEIVATRLPWQPRWRRHDPFDFAGAVLAVLSIPLLALEWLLAVAIGLVRPSTKATCVTAGPPPVRLVWNLESPAAARVKAEDVALRIGAGEDVAPDADGRAVGA